MEEKLAKFSKINNPKKLAELRKYCNTTLSNQSASNHDEPQSKNRKRENHAPSLTNVPSQRKINKHFVSSSDAGASSLLTVGYENSKLKKGVDSKDPSPLWPNEKSNLKIKSKPYLAPKRLIESDPLLMSLDEVEKIE